MRVTTKGRYGMRAMLELAMHGNHEEPVLMGDIADRLGVSRKYLHALLTTLKAAGLVHSVRGSGGGYRLARDAREINLAEILVALEGCDALVSCVGNGATCRRRNNCIARGLWQGLSNAVQSYLAGINLQDLAEGKANLEVELPASRH